MKSKKTWREKLASANGLPKVAKLSERQQKIFGGKTLAIPAPLDVDALMRQVPKGRVTTINELRGAVARQHRAEAGCPITTGIFAKIAAFAAEDDHADGRKRITPWWRTLKGTGELNGKYPGGVAGQRRRLAAEGHRFTQRGSKVRVADYQTVLHTYGT